MHFLLPLLWIQNNVRYRYFIGHAYPDLLNGQRLTFHCCDSILASMFVTNAAYRFLESKKCTEVLIQEIEHRSKEELTLRSSYREFPIGSIGLNITSLDSHFTTFQPATAFSFLSTNSSVEAHWSYTPFAQQAQHAKQNGLEIWCAIIGAESGNNSRPKGGLPGVGN